MTAAAPLLPLLALGATAVIVMVQIGFHRAHRWSLGLTLGGLGAAFALLAPAAAAAPRPVTGLLMIDRYALFFTGLILAATFVAALLAYDYLERQRTRREEFYVLLLIAAAGAAVLASSLHFASFFLGLETLSIALYGLCAYPHHQPLPLEAGIKYLVLAASSGAFLLFGMALVYAASGTMDFRQLAAAPLDGSLALPGMALILVGIGFKLGLVPFHLWTPDVYEGAPAPVTAFIATVSKAGVFALLLRFFNLAGTARSHPLTMVLTVVAIASMAGGNLLALAQSNVKRILAYSSIAHMGYLVVAFQAGGAAFQGMAAAAVGFYFAAYFVTTLGAFGVISALSTGEGEPDTLEDFRGLYWQRPWLATVFTAMLLSLAGIPLTAGFVAKFYVVAAGEASTLWLLVLVLVISSVIGLFYYLRIVAALFSGAPARGPLPQLPAIGAWVLGALFVGLIWIGVYPEPLLRLLLAATPGR